MARLFCYLCGRNCLRLECTFGLAQKFLKSSFWWWWGRQGQVAMVWYGKAAATWEQPLPSRSELIHRYLPHAGAPMLLCCSVQVCQQCGRWVSGANIVTPLHSNKGWVLELFHHPEWPECFSNPSPRPKRAFSAEYLVMMMSAMIRISIEIFHRDNNQRDRKEVVWCCCW